MDATTPRDDDDRTPAGPADPPPQVEPAQPRTAGASAVGAAPAQPAAEPEAEPAAEPARDPEPAPTPPAIVDDGPEDPSVPDTAVEATLTSEPAGSSPEEPVMPTSRPDDVAITSDAEPEELEEPEEEHSASQPEPVPASAHVASAPRPPAAEPYPAGDQTATPQREVVYVAAPNPPKNKGNRGVGVLIAAVSAFVFLFFYALISLLIRSVMTGDSSILFLSDQSFYIPVLLFTIAFIVLALIVNRAGWWSFVLGSLFVGLFVYLGTIGVLLLLQAGSLTPAAASGEFRRFLVNPLVVAAGLVAREVALWVGAGISARGRRVKARNAEARAEYEREQAERRAEIERNGAVVRPA